MILRYRDPQFWRKFRDNHWKPQKPTVLRQPFVDFPFSEDLLLQALKKFAADLAEGDERKPCMVSVGDKEIAPRKPLKTLFREKAETLPDLEHACARVFPGKTFGLMVTQMQAVHPGIWEGLTSFLHDGREALDLPVPRAFVDLFYGNYTSTFTGVHKDTQEILAFVVRGKKRMLAWPFEYFQSRLDEVSAGDRFFNKRLSIDPRDYRKDAIVLDANAGDVFYWPSDYWHVSEVQDGQFSAMVSMGLFRPPVKISGEAGAKERDAAPRLRWLTSYGFEQGGPVADRAEKSVTVVRNANCQILWAVQSRRIVVAANGHSLTLPSSAKVLKTLDALLRDEPVTVAESAGANSYDITESHWDTKLNFKTRKRSSRRDAAAWLVDWLQRVYAVRVTVSAPS